jgi:hypothetical protein
VVGYYSSGADPDSPTKPGIEKQQYRFGPFSEAGCHVVSLLGVYVHDLDALNTVWDSQLGPGAAADPIWVNYLPTDPTSSTWGRGDTCDPQG